ncbi:hypothetical protein IAI58_17845 (plasmid) [Roseomonas marmotae]|uniref:hypothetical protein n=1 Tax=Roseomonas marmotae TaxID=2768161 RepID=UPI001AD66151|nr:hypothetical protein [Roseomonas marmotae]QTI81205.1 hypothetical protein IAI58_17845 [Roseomonas marmotae]
MTRKSDAASVQKLRFIEAARKLGANEDEDDFRAKLAVIARQKPKGAAPPNPPKAPKGKKGG